MSKTRRKSHKISALKWTTLFSLALLLGACQQSIRSDTPATTAQEEISTEEIIDALDVEDEVRQEESSHNPLVLNCQVGLGHHLYLAEYTCPLDGERFESLSLGTHSRFGHYLDWEPVSYMRFPAPLPVCPSSGMVAAKDDYSDEELSRIGAAVHSDEYQQLYQAKHASFYLYAKQKEFSGYADENLWQLYLQATWEADYCEAEQRYREYALATIAKIQEYVEKSEAPSELDTVMLIIRANLYRRIGDFTQAQIYAAQIPDPQSDDPESDEYLRNAISTLKQAIAQHSSEKTAIEEPE